jgi:DHA2 family multidrug resistance protein-like MFS transporter
VIAQPIASSDGIADPGQRHWAIASVLAGMVLVVLDAAIANIALPTIATSLQVTPASAVQVVTAYQLGLVVMLLPAAALGESLGFARVFTAGAALFTAASVLCALSPSLSWLVVARFVQGVGGSGIMALGVALLRLSVPSHRLGTAIGWNAMTVALSSAAGPTLGAAILSLSSWHWLFAVNLPIGACVLLAARSFPQDEGTGRSVDLLSAGTSALLFAFLVIGAKYFPAHPALATVLFIGAIILATMLVRRESTSIAPLIPLDLLRQTSFRVSVTASVLCFIGQTAALVALPFYFQHTIGLSPLLTALYLLPWPLTVAITGPIAGRLADRVSTAWLCLIGGVFLAVGLGLGTFLPLLRHQLALGICMMVCGLGFGLFNVANNRSMFLSAPRERSGAAGGLQGVARLSGQTLGAVVMTFLFATTPLSAAPRIGLGIASALTLASGLVSTMRFESTTDQVATNVISPTFAAKGHFRLF